MKCQLYQLHQIPGSLSFAWHSVVLLLGSWWKWWKYDIFPKRRTFSDDSNPVIFIHFPSISCPKKSSSGAHSRGERWNVSSQKPNWTFTKCSMNMQSCEHATAQEKDKTSYTLYTGNGMLARNMFQAILTAKTYAKKNKTSLICDIGSISINILHLNPDTKPEPWPLHKGLDLRFRITKCSLRYEGTKLSCLDLGPSLGPTCINL